MFTIKIETSEEVKEFFGLIDLELTLNTAMLLAEKYDARAYEIAKLGELVVRVAGL